MPRRAAIALAFIATSAATSGAAQDRPADVILVGGRVWTGDPARPGAEGVAIAGDRIIAVGSEADVMRHRVASTRAIYLSGAFVGPGFIDNHTHFQNAGALLVGVNLLDVATEAGLVQRVREARDRLPPGARVDGPALLLDDFSTTIVRPGWRADAKPEGHIRLTRA
ncbi:MAG: hypothetical protein HUU27_07940 [Phycisphaerae bacterium]|nr:hypothetical protein [Phycisphaerae bacterium]